MASEQQKAAALAHIEARARQANDNGLPSVAAIWDEYRASVAARPAQDIVIARDFANIGFKE